MTKVAILPENSTTGDLSYRAVAGGYQASAKTAGAALDALTLQLPAESIGTIIIVQNQQPDEFFTARQQIRLDALMQRWREAREAGATLPAVEQVELDALVEAEVRASGQRAAAILADLAE